MAEEEKRKRKVDCRVLSDTPCRGNCGRMLKQNLAKRKPTAQYCFVCFKADSPSPVRTFMRLLPNGTKTPRKVVDYRQLAKTLRSRNVNAGRK